MHFPKLKTKAILSPLTDINDIAFRLLCKEYGCELTYTQMVSATAAARRDKSIMKVIDVIPSEKPYGIQLFGQDAKEMVNAVKFIEEAYEPSIIDLNMGCPSNKIMGQGAGAALLVKPQKIAEIVKAASSALNTPFTVKIRLGIDERDIVALDVAKICEQNGAAALAVHGRTMKQGYSGKADWSMIKRVKEAVSIPVIGNGDVLTPLDAERMLKTTGCDYMMVGRAAMKGPIVFKSINDYLSKGAFEKVTREDKFKMMDRYIELAEEHKVEFERVKIHMQHFTTGMSGGAAIRNLLGRTKKVDDVRKILSASEKQS